MLAVTNIPLDVPVSNLSIAQCQLIEIAKALRADAKIFILDEPTTALTLDETEALFKVLNKLRSSGTAILYVSHRMEEIFKISVRITVFRDGEYVDCVQTSQVSNNQVISMMVGRDLENMYPKKEREIGPTALKVSTYQKEPFYVSIVVQKYHWLLQKSRISSLTSDISMFLRKQTRRDVHICCATKFSSF